LACSFQGAARDLGSISTDHHLLGRAITALEFEVGRETYLHIVFGLEFFEIISDIPQEILFYGLQIILLSSSLFDIAKEMELYLRELA